MPLPVPIPPSPQASEAILAAFEATGDQLAPQQIGARARSRPQGGGAQRRLGVALRPVPRGACASAPAVVVDSGLTQDGWIPVDPADPADQVRGGVRGRRRHQCRYTQGRGVRGRSGIGGGGAGSSRPCATTRPNHTYDGHGICYMEFGGHEIASIDVTFLRGACPAGSLEGPRCQPRRGQIRLRYRTYPALVRQGLDGHRRLSRGVPRR